MVTKYRSKELIPSIEVGDNAADIAAILPKNRNGEGPSVKPRWFRGGEHMPDGDGAPTGFLIGGSTGTLVAVGWFVVVRNNKFFAMPPDEFNARYEREPAAA